MRRREDEENAGVKKTEQPQQPSGGPPRFEVTKVVLAALGLLVAVLGLIGQYSAQVYGLGSWLSGWDIDSAQLFALPTELGIAWLLYKADRGDGRAKRTSFVLGLYYLLLIPATRHVPVGQVPLLEFVNVLLGREVWLLGNTIDFRYSDSHQSDMLDVVCLVLAAGVGLASCSTEQIAGATALQYASAYGTSIFVAIAGARFLGVAAINECVAALSASSSKSGHRSTLCMLALIWGLGWIFGLGHERPDLILHPGLWHTQRAFAYYVLMTGKLSIPIVIMLTPVSGFNDMTPPSNPSLGSGLKRWLAYWRMHPNQAWAWALFLILAAQEAVSQQVP